MGFDLLHFLQPVLNFVPTVPKPKNDIDIRRRLMYTFAALALYLVCTLTPLYGVRKVAHQDPMYHLRLLTASSKYTLMELGISPIVSSGMILQLLSGFGLINRDQTNQESTALFDAAQKLAGLVMTLFQACTALFTGQYGVLKDIGVFGSVAIIAQLLVAAVVVILLDEMLQNGYGIGSGISLFIATNICEQIVWRLFSFQSFTYGRGKEYEGAIVAFFHLLITRKDKLRAIREAMFRSHLPNLSNVFSTLLVFIAVIFFEHIKIDVRLMTTVNRADPKPFEIKLFYASTTPIIVQSTVISQICSFSRIICSRWPESIVTRILGVWRSPEQGLGDEYAVPISGLAYYLQAPTSIKHTLNDPLHTLIYLIIILSSAGIIAYYYINISGQSAKDVANSLKAQHLTIQGHREDKNAIAKKLNYYIPTAAALGGILTGLLSFVADFLGAFGSGTGIILAVSILYQFAEEVSKEAAKSGGALSFLF
ncbi:protein transporter Sec61 subunit alpha isoform 2 [Histomonas meleagridis]|uniref:protein transporter Sec61 subunit alpha isoform 2 n=1 Tax=Histomonas meleagridis TaxID=135588 RepID=UPI00355A9F1F|nr:protein transporter Sec61 subunit alpha isoform 2 [Histomonas meleagridis]KAH0795313.1 protein transporter Sec61 subunit alpha isoform 2 [Histomonas meleagridis]KAH0804479.1 protein transporter Sec61 subunit alpha isoform 2 [Histomonas meleagridis]KAH0804840.1 protein transporter Sec61 subunit alpha isoform 2 [Histomonas meleagridis]